jgi:F0F1-type ATP synthase assembly protein I
VVRKATQKEQENRYQNAQEMLEDFNRLKDKSESPEPTPEPTPTVKIPGWVWAAVPVAGIAVGALIGLLIF